MDVFKGAKNSIFLKKPLALTMGNFDGLHLGHQKLILETVKKSKKINGLSCVLTFDPHPAQVLRPDKKPKRLYELERTIQAVASCGVDYLVIESFDKAFALTTAQDFIENYLVEKFRPQEIVVGYDFAFGADRAGTFETLKAASKKFGFQVTLSEALLHDGQPISSSRIREKVLSGRVDEVPPLLGREYSIVGGIVRGDQRGRQIGFRTANILYQNEIVPPPGVYATRLRIKDQVWPSITNIGFRPTFIKESKELSVEAHVFQFEQDIYGENVELFLVKKIRDEARFSSVADLKRQIEADVLIAKEILETKK